MLTHKMFWSVLVLVAGITPVLSQDALDPAIAAVPVCPRVCGGGAYPAYAPAEVAFPGGVIGLPDIPYGAGSPGVRPLTSDLYLPPQGYREPRPFLVYIHGGSWSGGGPRTTGAYENWPGVLAFMASKGYVVASVSYRLTREARFPAAIQDVKAAIRFLRMNASKYNIDKSRGATLGVSAGGQLASLAAVSCGAASGARHPRRGARRKCRPRSRSGRSEPRSR